MLRNKSIRRGLLVIAFGVYALLAEPKPAYAFGTCYICNASLPEYCGLGGEAACAAYCPEFNGSWACGNTLECDGEETLICSFDES